MHHRLAYVRAAQFSSADSCGDDGVSNIAERHPVRSLPLFFMALRRVVDALRALPRAVRLGSADCPAAALAELVELVRAITPADLGLPSLPSSSSSAASAPSTRSCMLSVPGWAEAALFELGPGGAMPLHSHPGLVLSKVLHGSLQLVAFTREGAAGAGARAPVRCTHSTLLRAGDVAVTQASRDNLHALRNPEAAGAALMLDFLLPPYADDADSHIYFSLVSAAGDASPFDAVEGTEYALRSLPDGPPSSFVMRSLPYAGRPVSFGRPPP